MRVELKTNFTVSLTQEFRRMLLVGGFLFLLAGAAVPSFGGTDSGADFLKIPIGAEAAGLGQAYTTLSQGVNALNYNPAGIAAQPHFLPTSSYGLAFSHQEQFIDTSLDHVGLVTPQSENHWAGGFNIVRMSYGSQEKRTSERQKDGSFDSSDMLFGAAIAKQWNGLLLGTQIKWISMNLAGYSARGVAADFGGILNIPDSRFAFGLSAKNLGPKMKFIGEEFNLPLTLSVGSTYRVIGPLSLSLDVQQRPYQHQTALALGTEIFASNTVTLRAGYLAKVAESVQNNQKEETNRGTFTNINGLAAGVGIRLNQFTIDYAITPFGELGNNHTLTLSSWFGGKPATTVELADPIIPETSEVEKPSNTQEERPILILPTDTDPLNQQISK